MARTVTAADIAAEDGEEGSALSPASSQSSELAPGDESPKEATPIIRHATLPATHPPLVSKSGTAARTLSAPRARVLPHPSGVRDRASSPTPVLKPADWCPPHISCCSVLSPPDRCPDGGQRGLIRFVSPWSASVARGQPPLVLCIPALEYWCLFLSHQERHLPKGAGSHSLAPDLCDQLRHLARVRPDAALEELVRELLPERVARLVDAPLELFVGDNFEGFVFFGIPLRNDSEAENLLSKVRRHIRRKYIQVLKIGRRLVVSTPALMAGFGCLFVGDMAAVLVSDLVFGRLETFTIKIMSYALSAGKIQFIMSKSNIFSILFFGGPPSILLRQVITVFLVPKLLTILAAMFPDRFASKAMKSFDYGIWEASRGALEKWATNSETEKLVGAPAFRELMDISTAWRRGRPSGVELAVGSTAQQARDLSQSLLEASNVRGYLSAVYELCMTALSLQATGSTLRGMLRSVSYVASSATNRVKDIWGESTMLSLGPDVRVAVVKVQRAVLNGDWSGIAEPIAREQALALSARNSTALVRELVCALDAAYALQATSELRGEGCRHQATSLSALGRDWARVLSTLSDVPLRHQSPQSTSPQSTSRQSTSNGDPHVSTAAANAQPQSMGSGDPHVSQAATNAFESGRAAFQHSFHEALAGLGVSEQSLSQCPVPALWAKDPEVVYAALSSLRASVH